LKSTDIDRYFERVSGGRYRATPEVWFAVLFFGLALAGILGGWVVKSRFEADAYNRVTGSNVSTWQAMWVELRVQGEAH